MSVRHQGLQPLLGLRAPNSQNSDRSLLVRLELGLGTLLSPGSRHTIDCPSTAPEHISALPGLSLAGGVPQTVVTVD